MPEANGSDILDDVKDLWDWVHTTLPSLVQSKWSNLIVDLDKIAAWGESAGGYLALQSALLFPGAKIKAVISQYCCLHPDVMKDHYSMSSDPEAHAVIDN